MKCGGLTDISQAPTSTEQPGPQSTTEGWVYDLGRQCVLSMYMDVFVCTVCKRVLMSRLAVDSACLQ